MTFWIHMRNVAQAKSKKVRTGCFVGIAVRTKNQPQNKFDFGSMLK